MPYLLTHCWPGATEEHPRAEIAAVHPSPTPLPAGQRHLDDAEPINAAAV